MTNDDSSLAENGGEEDGGGLPTVSGVKASFILHAHQNQAATLCTKKKHQN